MDECSFDVVVKDFRATDLTTRNRFRDKLRVVGDWDGKKFKTKKELVGGGDVNWKYTWKYEYKIFAASWLEQKELKLKLMSSKTECYGTVTLDLYTIATGPLEHNLPIKDLGGKTVGRLNFGIEMSQVANIAVVFKEVKLRHLKPSNKECNPYLKYAYSKMWPLVVDGRAKACYTSVSYNTTDPHWHDLPELRFSASLKEILHESIVLHVTHHGKISNTTLGRCNLLFRTLVDNGKTFKDEDLISFKGPLKVENAEIEGYLMFKFLPKFAQMKAVNVVRKAIHTENGIFDAMPLMKGLPTPKIPIILTDESKNDSSDDKKKKKEKKEKKDKETRKSKDKEIDESLKEEDPAGVNKKEEKKEEIKEPEPNKKETMRSGRMSAAVMDDMFNDMDPNKDRDLFPHHEDSPSTPRRSRQNNNTNLRKNLMLSDSMTAPASKDLMSFSPIATRKAANRGPMAVSEVKADNNNALVKSDPYANWNETPTMGPMPPMGHATLSNSMPSLPRTMGYPNPLTQSMPTMYPGANITMYHGSVPLGVPVVSYVTPVAPASAMPMNNNNNGFNPFAAPLEPKPNPLDPRFLPSFNPFDQQQQQLSMNQQTMGQQSMNPQPVLTSSNPFA